MTTEAAVRFIFGISYIVIKGSLIFFALYAGLWFFHNANDVWLGSDKVQIVKVVE
jgi:hypothetical protein